MSPLSAAAPIERAVERLAASGDCAAVLEGLVPTVVMNLILTAPVYALVRRLLRPHDRSELSTEVRLLG